VYPPDYTADYTGNNVSVRKYGRFPERYQKNVYFPEKSALSLFFAVFGGCWQTFGPAGTEVSGRL
jgi:hypothetical protein